MSYSVSLCNMLGCQRTILGDDPNLQSSEYLPYIRSFFQCTYNPTNSEERRVAHHLKEIRRLGNYLWVLAVTGLNFTQFRKLQNFKEFRLTLTAWMTKYPISPSLEVKASSLLQTLDTVGAGVQKRRNLPKIKLPDENLFPIGTLVMDDTLDPGLPFQLPYSHTKGTQQNQQFLDTLDSMCGQGQSCITRISSSNELVGLLETPFRGPIIWRRYDQQYPLHDLPSSISQLLRKLRLFGVSSLSIHDYTATPHNSLKALDDILKHFEAPAETCRPLNFLDIRNIFKSRVPVEINEADILHLARRRQGTGQSVSKSEELGMTVDPADNEFFLLSSRGSVSTLHVDTAGSATFIIILSGRKIWYTPHDLGRKASEVLAAFGSPTPEFYKGFDKIELSSGDMLIMPPGCPHAVFTPEHSLAFGGSFYTLPHLDSSLEILSLQDKAGDSFSNEDLTKQDFLNFTAMLTTCKELLYSNLVQPIQLADVASCIVHKRFKQIQGQIRRAMENRLTPGTEAST
ncbi:uncharacterized protein BDV14DRAFT_140048 [Aspergillus stella-maris]|uniref:uncharacterized protein n=1 Tax=Aspergillus stella-maris TaxID=1810926 RepID=UPI003CCD2AD7